MASNATPAEPLLINAGDAAKSLAISPRKLWELTAGGAIPHVRIGRSVRYKPSDLAAWIDQVRTPAKEQT